ncbi:MAG: MarR family winged helix-turn-helix transcriptional regulator [Huintestinicola sp.]
MNENELVRDRLMDVMRNYYYAKYPSVISVYLLGETKVLDFLAVCGKADINPGEIARELDMTNGRITGILRTLESKGFISRTKNDADKRQVHVNLTDEGAEYVRKRQSEILDFFSRVIGQMGAERSEMFIDSLNCFIDACNAVSNSADDK